VRAIAPAIRLYACCRRAFLGTVATGVRSPGFADGGNLSALVRRIRMPPLVRASCAWLPDTIYKLTLVS
jgi:hypothetical protein